MVFRALYELYDRLEADPGYSVAPVGRSYQNVSFVLVLERDGTLVNIEDARQPGDRFPQPRRVLVLGVNKPSGAGLNPCFLWDAPGYLLGWEGDSDPKKKKRAIDAFAAFRDRHLQVENELRVSEFSTVCRFLERWKPALASEFPILGDLGRGFGVFLLRGATNYVHEAPPIAKWWDRRTEGDPEQMRGWWKASAERGKQEHEGQCLVTGCDERIARVHPKIKGVAGAQPSGATIAGFNDSAYWSYGLDQSFNAPVSVDAARRYTTALNNILDGLRRDKHKVVIGGTTVAFWTDHPSIVEDVFVLFAAEGSAAIESAQDELVRAKIKAFLRAMARGREAYLDLGEDPESTVFFILGLAAPTPARVAVRFFHRGSLANLLETFRRHYAAISIERQFGEGSKHPEPGLPSAQFLLDETCPWERNERGGRLKPMRKQIPPLLPATLLESIITGVRYPDALYSTVLRRMAADRVVNYARAAVIKGYLVRNLGKEVLVSLDTSRTDPAYRLGRLFAALEKTQADALGGGVNATIRDRFYSAASATPAAVFPRLLRSYQHHLAKMEGGLKVNREKLVQEVLDPLESFPAHLGLAEQGLFALGYYHQTNDFYRPKDNRSSAEEA